MEPSAETRRFISMDKDEQRQFIKDPAVELALYRIYWQFRELQKICRAKGVAINLLLRGNGEVGWSLRKIREEDNNVDL